MRPLCHADERGELQVSSQASIQQPLMRFYNGRQDAGGRANAFLVASALVGCNSGVRRSCDRALAIAPAQYNRIPTCVCVVRQRQRAANVINVSLPEHKTIPFCLPVQQTATSFVCSGLNWELSRGEEAVIFVNDPALNRVVATNVFVNGTRISRIETLSNGNELGRFHMTSSGRIE